MGGRADDNTLLEDPHITSPDKAKGGRGSARRTLNLWAENRSEPQSHSSSLRPGHCNSKRAWIGVLSGHSHGRQNATGGSDWGTGGDGETSDSEMDTAMHETGRAPRAEEVGESDQQIAHDWLQLCGTTEMLKH